MYLVEIDERYYVDAEKIVSVYKTAKGLWEIALIDGSQYVVSESHKKRFLNHIDNLNCSCNELQGIDYE